MAGERDATATMLFLRTALVKRSRVSARGTVRRGSSYVGSFEVDAAGLSSVMPSDHDTQLSAHMRKRFSMQKRVGEWSTSHTRLFEILHAGNWRGPVWLDPQGEGRHSAILSLTIENMST